MDRIFHLTSAVKQVGKVHHAVSERVCKASAKTDVTVRYLIAQADHKWTNRYGNSGLSLATVVDNLMQIGVIVAGLDPVPVIAEPIEKVRRISDEAA
ncbi:MAG: hypothetical protein WCD42_06545 [Rhizomicrobium sp.]